MVRCMQMQTPPRDLIANSRIGWLEDLGHQGQYGTCERILCLARCPANVEYNSDVPRTNSESLRDCSQSSCGEQEAKYKADLGQERTRNMSAVACLDWCGM
jgi:hypothetical protein